LRLADVEARAPIAEVRLFDHFTSGGPNSQERLDDEDASRQGRSDGGRRCRAAMIKGGRGRTEPEMSEVVEVANDAWEALHASGATGSWRWDCNAPEV